MFLQTVDGRRDVLVTGVQTCALPISDLAYRYCRHQPGIDTVMFGTGCFDHLHQNIASLLRPALPEEVVAYLDRAFAAVDAFTGN